MAKDKKAAVQDATAGDTGEDATAPALRIASAQEGRWRAGRQHPRQAQLYPAGAFTLDQIERLEGDPVLVVERLTDEHYAAAVEQASAKAAQN